MTSTYSISAPHLAGGYHAQMRNRRPEELSQPSLNVRYTKDGAAETRPGYDETAWDLSEAGNAAKALYIKQFNVTFVTVNGKVKYIDHNNSDTVVDTGVTYTAGQTTRIAEYAGDVYVTNPTDGMVRIMVTRLDGAVSSGAGSIVTDIDGASRASVFGVTSGNLRINGTNEAYSSITVGTGTFTLSGTASQNYTDNTIAIVVDDNYSSNPKGSKIVFWKESMNVIGVQVDSGQDQPKTTLFFSKFATSLTLEDIVDFSASPSGTELVGKSGILKNIFATRDYIYLFKENESYYIGVGDVNLSSGARPPRLLSSKFGCLNEDSASDMGGDLVWITNNNRIMRSRTEIVDGGAVLVADEGFDEPLRELLDLMDNTQDNPIVFYAQSKKLLFVQLSIDGQIMTFVYDNNVGAWCPPDTNKHFNDYFEIDSAIYATDANDDTIYEVETGTSDNGSDIESCIATGVFQSDDGLTTMDAGILDVIGELTTQTIISYEPQLNGATGNVKEIDDSVATFEESSPFDAVEVGALVVGGSGFVDDYARFRYETAITPSLTEEVQHKWCSSGDGHKFRIKSWIQRGERFNSPLLTTN